MKDEQIRERVEFLMSKGQECYPFGTRTIKHYNNATKQLEEYTYYNFFEALDNLKPEQQKKLSELFQEDSIRFKQSVNVLVNEYWEKQALYLAENE